MAQAKKYVAFLRAVNVGGRVVKMDRLRAIFESLGLKNVETFIASGNVIFESAVKDLASLEKKIEKELQKSLGYAVTTFLRSVEDLKQVAECQPFAKAEMENEGNTLYIAFLPTSPEAELQKKLLAFRNPVDDFHVRGREVYWLCRKTMSRSDFSGATLEKTLRVPATLRNVTTVRKLAAKCS